MLSAQTPRSELRPCWIPISGSSYWLIQRLRTEFGFMGYVVSDSDALEYLYNKHHVAADLKDAVYQAFMAGMNVRTTFRTPRRLQAGHRERMTLPNALRSTTARLSRRRI